jgi:predicted aspartyl protease
MIPYPLRKQSRQTLRMNKHRLSLVAIFILSACAASPPPCQQTATTSLHVYFDSTATPFVLAGLNTTPAAMLVDTGAETTLISQQIAGEAGLSKKIFDQPVVASSDDGELPAYITTVPQLVLGNAVAKDAKIVAFVKPTSAWAFGTKSAIDGSLGNDIWQNYDVDLNFPARTMTLYNKISCVALPLSWSGKITAVAVTIDYYGEVFVPVTIDGHRLMAMLDTGTTKSTLPALLIATSGLSSGEAPTLKTINIVTITGIVRAKVVGFNKMDIGTETIKNPIFAVPEIDPNVEKLLLASPGLMNSSNPFMAYNKYNDMILGEDFIRAHRMFISYGTHMLYIQN